MAIPEYGVFSYSSQTTQTTIPLTVPAGGYAAGDAVFIYGMTVPSVTAGAATVTDTRGNTWTAYRGGDNTYAMFFCAAILTTALQAGDTVTITTASSTKQLALMWGRTGVGSLTLDGPVQFHGTAPAASAAMIGLATGTLAVVNEQVYGCFSCAATGSAADAFTAGAGWDVIGSVTPTFASVNRSVFVEAKRPAEILPIQPFASHTAGSYYGTTIVFRDVLGAGGSATPTGAHYKILGQSNPSANTDTTLYSVPPSRESVCSTLLVCNTASSATTFRVASRIAGATLAAPQYLFYDQPIAALTTACVTIGVTLGPSDIVTVRAASASVNFHLYGQELTP